MGEGEGQLRTISSTRNGIGLLASRGSALGEAGLYPSDFDIVEQDLAVTVHEVSSDSQLDVFFIPVGHGHSHLGTTPRPFCA